jgi:hypothetical protein
MRFSNREEREGAEGMKTAEARAGTRDPEGPCRLFAMRGCSRIFADIRAGFQGRLSDPPKSLL